MRTLEERKRIEELALYARITTKDLYVLDGWLEKEPLTEAGFIDRLRDTLLMQGGCSNGNCIIYTRRMYPDTRIEEEDPLFFEHDSDDVQLRNSIILTAVLTREHIRKADYSKAKKESLIFRFESYTFINRTIEAIKKDMALIKQLQLNKEWSKNAEGLFKANSKDAK